MNKTRSLKPRTTARRFPRVPAPLDGVPLTPFDAADQQVSPRAAQAATTATAGTNAEAPDVSYVPLELPITCGDLLGTFLAREFVQRRLHKQVVG